MVSADKYFRNTAISATLLALANMGDAFLYVYLPANHAHLGIPSWWVGIILSVNRLTRLFFNGVMAWLLCKKGVRMALFMATIVAALTTLSYGFWLSLPVWLFARMLWGMSFSTLRLGNALYALQQHNKGLALGTSRAVVELGPVAALWIGPSLLLYAGAVYTFATLAAFSVAGLLLWPMLGSLQPEQDNSHKWNLSWPDATNMLVLFNAFATDGILVVLAGRLLGMYHSLQASDMLPITGMLLGYRRVSLVVFTPLSGWLADRVGFDKLFFGSMAGTVLGLILMMCGMPVAGLAWVFTCNAVNAAVAVGVGIKHKNSLIKEVTDNATWRDLGTAGGAFAGALLLTYSKIQPLLWALSGIYVALLGYVQWASKNK